MAERMIRLFGEPEVILDGEAIELSVALPTLALFVLWRNLGTANGERLAKALKPDSDAGEPTAFLKKHKQKLRELLQLDLPNTLKPKQIGPAILQQAWVDVVEFDAKIDSIDQREVRDAVALRRRGPLLAPLTVLEVFTQERASREKKYQRALGKLIEEFSQSQPEEAAQFLDLLLECDGLDPSRAAALRERRAALEQELVQKPKGDAGNSVRPTPQQKLPNFPTNLIGRDAEMEAVQKLLNAPGLVTLTGTAGIGKTRLAAAVADRLQENFPGGAVFVDLTTAVDAAEMAAQISKGLGLPEEKNRSRRETLLAFLEDRRLLLIWDNCEHLAADCAALATEMLQRSSLVHLLVTSRETLRVYGERCYFVRVLSEDNAVRLFSERAQAVNSGFSVHEQNRVMVRNICRALDCLPLALELAAALVDVRTVKWIADNLHRRFEVLIEGPRAGVPHHTSLQIAFDLSYEPLPEAEQALFRALGVFAGSFSADAVSAVTFPEAAPLLPHLVRKSLVLAEERDDEMRFELLASAQQYARHRLRAQGEWEETRRKHRAYYRHLAELAHSALLGPEEKRWLDRLETEMPNLRAALVSYRESEEGGDEWTLLTAWLWWFWWNRGSLTEGMAYLQEALEQATQVTETSRSLALEGAGNLAYHLGDYTAGRAWMEQALTVVRRTGQGRNLAKILLSSGAQELINFGSLVATSEGNAFVQARFQEALEILRRMDDHHGVAVALTNLGIIAYNQKDYPRAKALYRECVEKFREVNDRRNAAQTLYCLGNVELDEGNIEDAERFLGESLAMFRDWKEPWRCLHILETFTVAAVMQEQYSRAGQIWGAAQAMRRQLASPMPPDHVQHYAPFLAQIEKALGKEAFTAGQAMTWEQAVAFTLGEQTAPTLK